MKVLQTQIQSMAKKGYSSESDIVEMTRAYTQLYEIASRVNTTAKNLHFSSGKEEIAKLKENIANIQQAINSIKSNLAVKVQNIFGIDDKKAGSRAEKLMNTFASLSQGGKDYKEILEEINNQLNELEKKQNRLSNDKIEQYTQDITERKSERDKNYKTLFSQNKLRQDWFQDQNGQTIDQNIFTDIIKKYSDLVKGTKKSPGTKKLDQIINQVKKEFEEYLKAIQIQITDNYDPILFTEAIEKKNDLGIFNLENTIKSKGASIENEKKKLLEFKDVLTEIWKMFEGNPEFKGFSEQIGNMQSEITIANNKLAGLGEKNQRMPSDDMSQYLELLIRNIRDLDKEERHLLQTQQVVDSTFSKITDAFERYFSATYIIRNVLNMIQQTFNDIEKIDKAFGSIAMVTNKTVADLWSSYGDYQEMANKLGQSTESAIKASALYYQQGNLTSSISGLRSEKIIDFI